MVGWKRPENCPSLEKTKKKMKARINQIRAGKWFNFPTYEVHRSDLMMRSAVQSRRVCLKGDRVKEKREK